VTLIAENTFRITGQLTGRNVIRWTPARLPVLEFSIGHSSRQMESGEEREVICELNLRAIGPIAHQIEAVAVGTHMQVEGFLAAKSARNRTLVLHVRTFELLEGIHHGI
jgi:primosomal replication protein N